MLKNIGIIATTFAATFPGSELEKYSFKNLPTISSRAEETTTHTITLQEQRTDRQPALPQDRFQPGSKARLMYEAIDRDLKAERLVAPERVLALFTQLREEPDTQVSFAPAYFNRFSDVPVRVAILNYFHDSSYLMSAMARLRDALKSPDTELQAAALRNVAKRADAVLVERSRAVLKQTKGTITVGSDKSVVSVAEFDSDGVFSDRSLPTQFLKSPSREVRVAAIRVSQLFGAQVTKLDLLDSIRASEALGEHALEAGCEVRLGAQLVEGLLATGAWKQGAEELNQIKMPLLHLLQRVDRSYSGLLDELATHGSLPKFVAGMGTRLREEREAASDTVIIDHTSKVFAALNDEEIQSHFQVEQLCGALDISSASIIKAPEIGTPRSDRQNFEKQHAQQLANPTSQEHRKKYLSKLDSLVVKDFKKEYSKALTRLADEPDALAMIWNLGHGEPQHFWFQEGLPGTMSRTDLHHPSGVSYKEIADALFSPARQAQAAAARPTLDLSRKLLILSPCLQYDMALSIMAELRRLANKHSVDIVMPNIIASNQRGMVSYANNNKLYEVPEVVNPEDPTGPKILSDDSYLMTVVSSHQFIDSLVNTSTDKRITIGDVFREDYKESQDLTEQLKDPSLLEPISQINKHDPAFFFSRGLDVDRCVRTTLKEIGERELLPPTDAEQSKGANVEPFHELGISLPPLPKIERV